MNTPLELVNELKDDLDGNWAPRLNELNLFQDKVEDLYVLFYKDLKTANTIFAYVVLAYSKGSSWLNIYKDRTQNKSDIMRSLAGENFKTKLPLVEAINGQMDPYNALIEWYIEYQCDHNWNTIVSGLEYHSKAQIMSKSAVTPKDMADSGKMLEYADKRLEKALELYEKIKKENVNLDSALKKENRKPFSDRKVEAFDFMSHEEYLKNRDQLQNGIKSEQNGNDFFNSNGDLKDSFEDDEPF